MIREFLFRPNPREPRPGPKWLGPVILIAAFLVVVGVIFARIAASRMPDPSTGQIHEIRLGKGSHWYLGYWQLIVYEALTTPALCVFGICAAVLLYNFVMKHWPSRRS
jgi:hypothetical protein